MLIILCHLHTANMPKESTAPFPIPGGWSWDTPSSFQLLRILSDSWLQFPRTACDRCGLQNPKKSLDFNIEDSSDSCCWWMFIPKNDGRKLWRWRWWSLKPASSFSYGSKSVTPPVLRSENMKIDNIDLFLQIDWCHAHLWAMAMAFNAIGQPVSAITIRSCLDSEACCFWQWAWRA